MSSKLDEHRTKYFSEKFKTRLKVCLSSIKQIVIISTLCEGKIGLQVFGGA